MTKAALVAVSARQPQQPPGRHYPGASQRIARAIEGRSHSRRYPVAGSDACHPAGRLLAAKETGIDWTIFPEQPPFSLDQLVELDNMPFEPSVLAR